MKIIIIIKIIIISFSITTNSSWSNSHSIIFSFPFICWYVKRDSWPSQSSTFDSCLSSTTF